MAQETYTPSKRKTDKDQMEGVIMLGNLIDYLSQVGVIGNIDEIDTRVTHGRLSNGLDFDLNKVLSARVFKRVDGLYTILYQRLFHDADYSEIAAELKIEVIDVIRAFHQGRIPLFEILKKKDALETLGLSNYFRDLDLTKIRKTLGSMECWIEDPEEWQCIATFFGLNPGEGCFDVRETAGKMNWKLEKVSTKLGNFLIELERQEDRRANQ